MPADNLTAPPAAPRSVQLANSLVRATTALEDYLSKNGFSSPSLEAGGGITEPLPAEVQEGVDSALEALDELQALLLGPIGWLSMHIHSAFNMASIQALHRYGVPHHIPPGGEVALEELARRSNPSAHLSNDCLARLIQHAVSIRVLSEPRPGHIAHSAASHVLATSPPMMDWIGAFSEDIWPAAPRVVDALAKWPGEPTPTTTGHNLAEGTSVPFFQTLATKPDRARRFASAMSIMQSAPGWDASAALSGFDWKSLVPSSGGGGGRRGTVVDVGGSDGTFGLALSRQHPELKVIVQDLPGVIQGTLASPRQNGDSIILQEHDFFTEQPVRGADVYFLRMILHDWPDEAATKILRQLVPALKPGARILINDHCVPPADSMSLLQKKVVRYQDLIVMAAFHGKERTQEQWAALVTRADPRLKVVSVTRVKNGPLALIEVVWQPDVVQKGVDEKPLLARL